MKSKNKPAWIKAEPVGIGDGVGAKRGAVKMAPQKKEEEEEEEGKEGDWAST